MASSEPSLPDKPKKWAAARMIAPARVMSTKICTSEMPPSLTTSPRTKRTPSVTIPIFNQNSYVWTPARKMRCRPMVLVTTTPMTIAHSAYSMSGTFQ
jgi:hypothetical protein